MYFFWYFLYEFVQEIKRVNISQLCIECLETSRVIKVESFLVLHCYFQSVIYCIIYGALIAQSYSVFCLRAILHFVVCVNNV